MSKNLKNIGAFTLAMLSISAILNLRNMPVMASLGMESIFFYFIAALFFLIPTSLASAELATKFPDNGGIYSWVKLALGEKAGFITIWLEWFNNVIAFPTTLMTIVATIAFAGMPELINNKYAMFSFMLAIFWGCTLFNFCQIKTSTKLNIIGSLCGTILPGALIIVLGIIWFVAGNDMEISTHDRVIPNLNPTNLSLLVIAFSGYSGMQILAFHVKNIKKPNTTLPKAIFLSAILIFSISLLATLSIASVLPSQDLNIVNGVINAFAIFFDKFNIGFLTPIFAIFISIGAIASLSAWLIGPARSMLVVANDGYLPKIFIKKNKAQMPVTILIFQGFIGTILASIYFFVPTIQDAFSLFIALTSQLTLIMFLLVFISAIKLRYAKGAKDSFKMPGGNAIASLVFILGIVACLFAFAMGFFPSSSIDISISTLNYIKYIFITDVFVILVPLVWLFMKQRVEKVN